MHPIYGIFGTVPVPMGVSSPVPPMRTRFQPFRAAIRGVALCEPLTSALRVIADSGPRNARRMQAHMELKTKRKTLRLISNGMYVITSRSEGHFGAATVTWISQASFKPPLIMAAIRTNSNVFKCMSDSGLAAIHILECNQQDFAQKFFFPTQANDGCINGEPFVDGVTGVPVLRNTPAHIECRVVRIVTDVGDHAIVILEVIEAECRDLVRPLTIAESPWEYGG